MSSVLVPVASTGVRAILHSPPRTPASTSPKFAAIMVAGAGGGLTGPGGIYSELGRSCVSFGGIGLQMDYRRPNHLYECVEDVLAAIRFLGRHYEAKEFILIGWSFGGAVVIDAGARSGQVRGVCTVASQTAGTDRVAQLSPKSLLLLHGTADTCLSPRCSQQLFSLANEPKELILYDGDNHGLTKNSAKVIATILNWIQQTIGVPVR